VYRTGQRFGAAHVVDVLVGNATEKITRNGHDTLSVFDIGKELAPAAWRSVIRQLVVQGHLQVDQERYGALALTAESRALLRGETGVRLRVDPKEMPVKKKKRTTTTADAIDGDDRILWDALRACRRRIAAEHGVPPYMIFHDSTLLQIVEAKPRNEEDLLSLSGVGKTKLDKYGGEFLQTVRELVG
jgi:ATP-dependent DNA helicase RecQ